MDIDDPELDPRLAVAYDGENEWGDDDDRFLRVVTDRPGARVVDLGCGTGTLTTAIALAGHAIVGVDPNPAFLAIAAAKPGGDRVAWIRGTAVDLPDAAFDVALMTANVAQHLVTDDEWDGALADLRRALVPGGVLAFDTRDPSTRSWETWPTRFDFVAPGGEHVRFDTTMTFVDDVAWFDGTVVLAPTAGAAKGDPGATWSRARWGYRFRDEGLLRATLTRAGFRVDSIGPGSHRALGAVWIVTATAV